MQRTNLRSITLLGAGCLLAAAAWFAPEVAKAYTENTPRSRLTTPAGTGCIDQVGGLVHGGSASPMTINGRALLTSATAANISGCVPANLPGVAKLIKGTVMAGLIKLNRRSTSANQPDDYSYCKIVSSGALPWGSEIRLDVSYPTPPCGPGHYAQIVCLQQVTTMFTDFVSFSITGNYNAVNLSTDCNVSPSWHPALDGHLGDPLIPVKL